MSGHLAGGARSDEPVFGTLHSTIVRLLTGSSVVFGKHFVLGGVMSGKHPGVWRNRAAPLAEKKAWQKGGAWGRFVEQLPFRTGIAVRYSVPFGHSSEYGRVQYPPACVRGNPVIFQRGFQRRERRRIRRAACSGSRGFGVRRSVRERPGSRNGFLRNNSYL